MGLRLGVLAVGGILVKRVRVRVLGRVDGRVRRVRVQQEVRVQKGGMGKPEEWVKRGGTDYWGMSWSEGEGR